MHVAYDSPCPCPAGDGGADPELWTDTVSAADRATPAPELGHAPGETPPPVVPAERANRTVILAVP